MKAISPSPSIANLITTYYVGSDQVILLGQTALVSSKSQPGQWREVDAVLNLCACPGYAARGRCRHVDATKAAMEMDRATARPVPAAMYPSTCPPTKEAWLPEPKPITRNPAPYGVCNHMTFSGRCRADATVTMEYADHHGSHRGRYCDKHADGLLSQNGWTLIRRS